MFKQQGLKGITDVFLITRRFGTVHWSVTHGDDPGCLCAVDTFEIPDEPLVLLVRLDFTVGSVDGAKRSTVGDVGLGLGRVGLVAFEVGFERVFGTVGEIGLPVNGDEVDGAVVERIPKVADAPGLVAGHVEAMLVRGEVSSHQKF